MMRTSSSSTSRMFSYAASSHVRSQLSRERDTACRRTRGGGTYSGADGATVTVASIVVSRVELIAHESGAVSADVLDFSQLWVGDNAASWVTWVRGNDDSGTTGDLFGDLVRVDMITIFLGQGDRDCGKLRSSIGLDLCERGSWAITIDHLHS